MTNTDQLEAQQLIASLLSVVQRLQHNTAAMRAKPSDDNAELLKILLADKGSATVAEVSSELKVSLKTANRLVHAACHAGECILVYEPFRTINRLRAWRDKAAYMGN